MTEKSDKECCPCPCKVSDESVPLVALAGCSTDDAAVASLPSDWVPKHGGPTLAKYLQDREQNHGKALDDITAKACILHKKIDEKVRELSEMLIAHIQQNNKDIQCVTQPFTSMTIVSVTEVRNDASKKISDLYNQRLEEIAQFKKNGMKLEKERADGMRRIMRDQFQRVIKVGHLPPKDLLHDFDSRMFEINQQILSNNRAYDEIESELRADADECVLKAKTALNHFCVAIANEYRPSLSSRRSTDPQIQQQKNKRESSIPGLGNINTIQEEVEHCITRLIEIYHNGIIKIMKGLSGKLIDLHETLTSNLQSDLDCADLCSQLERMVEDSIRRITKMVQKIPQSFVNDSQFVQITPDDIGSIQSSLITLGKCIRETYLILHDAGHLWDAHMLRLALAQKLTMTAVEDLSTNNDVTQQTSDVLFNITLEQMYSAPDVDKLNMFYNNLKVMLQNIEDIYVQHNKAELGRLEQYMNLPPMMGNILLAEFQCFLEKYPRDPIIIINENDPQKESLADKYTHSPIRRAILQTAHQVQSLKNWRNGFLETFECNMGWVPEELKRQARQWVDTKSIAINSRSSLKKLSHNIRTERIKSAFDKRLAELTYHDKRLTSHMNGITDIVESMPKKISQYLDVDAPELYPLKDWLQRMKDNMQPVLSPDADPEVRIMKLSSVPPRLAIHRRLFEESVKRALEEYSIEFQLLFQSARVSNVRFSHEIKLLGEGGSYSVFEANKASAELLRASTLLESAVNRLSDCINSRHSHLMGMADECITPIQKTVEEFVKPARKPGADKTQAADPKKKKK